MIPATAHTCGPIGSFNDVLKDSPGSREGGCTRDLVHRFYEEQYQLNGGAQNRYAAVNTMLPAWQPTGTFAPVLPALGAPTIGDRLSAKSVDWAWYAGGWSNAAGDKGGPGWTNGGGADGTA